MLPDGADDGTGDETGGVDGVADTVGDGDGDVELPGDGAADAGGAGSGRDTDVLALSTYRELLQILKIQNHTTSRWLVKLISIRWSPAAMVDGNRY